MDKSMLNCLHANTVFTASYHGLLYSLYLIENTYMIMLTIVWHVRTMQENGCTGMELLK